MKGRGNNLSKCESYRKHLGALAALTMVFSGCAQKPADEGEKTEQAQPAATTAERKAAPASTPRSTSQPAAPAAPPAAPAPVAATIATGTALEVRLTNGLSSKSNKDGDSFSASVENAVEVDGKVVIPKGAEVAGRVTKAVPSGRLKQRAELWVELTSVTIRGKRYDVDTSTTGHKEGSKATRDIVFIGGGAGAGAAIGGAVGGGKGAGIGAAIGAAAGTAGAMMTGQRDVEFPAESVLRFKLEQDLTVRP